LQAEDTVGGRDAFNRATEFALLLTLPAALALVLIAPPIVSVLFGRGAFDAEAVANTALVAAIYGAGLPAFVLQKVLQPLFFARADTVSPFRYALVAMLTNAVLAIGLAPFIGFSAAALATSLAAWVMVGLLWHGSRPMGEAAQLDARLRRRLGRILLACGVMGAALLATQALFATALYTPALRYGALAVLVFVGIASYFAAAQVLGAASFREIRSAMRRKA
jgi:putative peptidoglycan lipid II flippase